MMFVTTCQIVLTNKMEQDNTLLVNPHNTDELNNNVDVLKNERAEDLQVHEDIRFEDSTSVEETVNELEETMEEGEHNDGLVQDELILTPPIGFDSGAKIDNLEPEKNSDLVIHLDTEVEEKEQDNFTTKESYSNDQSGFEDTIENNNEELQVASPIDHEESNQSEEMTNDCNDLADGQVNGDDFEEWEVQEKADVNQVDNMAEKAEEVICPDPSDVLDSQEPEPDREEGESDETGEVIAESIIQQKDDTKKFWENKMISARQEETVSPPPGFDDIRSETPVSQTSSGSILLVEVPDDSFVSVGDLLPEEDEPKKNYMYHDAAEAEKKDSNFEESDSMIEIAKWTNNPTETFIEREIRMQNDREKQILAERQAALKNAPAVPKPVVNNVTKVIRPISKASMEFPRPEKHKTAEALISQEIEDLKRREEELKWRQSTMGSRENLLNDDQFASITTTDEGHYSDNDNASDERESPRDTPQPNNLHKSQSLESLSSGHSSGEIPSYNPTSNVTTETRRRRITVKPFEDADEQTTVPAHVSSKETPIEREIRLSRDRDEELRRDRTEKGLPVWANNQTKKVEVQKVSTAVVQDPNRGVQLRMATSRIQAEIQEITEKEKELRIAGKIHTTSEETVDSKVQRLSHLAEYSSELRQARENKRGPLSRAVSTPQLNIEPENTRVPPLTRGFSTQSAAPKNPNPFTVKKTSAPPAGANQRGLMQKFINSRGKQTTVSVSSPEPPEIILTQKSNPVKASVALNPVAVEKLAQKEVQEPSIPPTAVTQKPSAPRRHYLTAEEKIQEEMKEMQRREEELRLQRMKGLTSSQPNLNGFEDGEPISDQDAFQSGENEAGENGSEVLVRRPSHTVNAIQNAAKNQRRKSHLIAEWENRIQQN